MFNLNKKIIFSISVIFFSLCSSLSFADKQSDLLAAVLQNKVEDVRALLEADADPKGIEHFSALPALEVSELLLKKGLDPSKFLDLVMHVYNYNDSQFVLKQKELIDLAIKEGANAKKVGYFGALPSFELSELLLKMGMDPSKFLGSVLGAYPNGDDVQWASKQKELIDLAFKEGANAKKVGYFGTLPSLELSKLLLTNGLDPSKFLGSVLDAYPSGDGVQWASKQKELIDLAIKEGANVKSVGHFGVLPPLETSEFLLTKGMDPSRFLGLVLGVHPNGDGVQWASKQKELIDFAIKEGANAKKVSRFDALPSLETSELLLKNGMDSSKFLDMILISSYSSNDAQFASKQKELLDLAFKEGANAKKISRFIGPPSLELSKLLLEKGLDPCEFIVLVMDVIHGYMPQQKELIDWAINEGADIQKIGSFRNLPSFEMSKFLLEKKLDPSRFLGLVMSAQVNHNRYDRDRFSLKQIELVNLAFKENANAQKIDYFSPLPSLEVSEVLLAKGLDPDRFVEMLAHVPCVKLEDVSENLEIDRELIGQRDVLVELAIKKGAKSRKIYEPILIPIIELINTVNNLGFENIETNIDLTNEEGKTVLMLAAEAGYVEFVIDALRVGADKNKKDKAGKTALMLAREKGEVKGYLEKLLQPEVNLGAVINGDFSEVDKLNSKEPRKVAPKEDL